MSFVHTQFTRPTTNTYIRIFGEEEEVFSINVRTSAAVTYPADTLGRTLTFNINNCQLQLPVNQTLYVLLDEGNGVTWGVLSVCECVCVLCVLCVCVCMRACVCVCI